MKDISLDVFDKYYLIMKIENIIMDLYDKKRGPSNDDKMEIQIDMFKKLLNIVKAQEISPKKHQFVFTVDDIGEVSDGSHTFNELYYHRMMLFACLCNTYKNLAWKSWYHHDRTMYDDYFIVGIDTPEGQYTYHYHKDYWDMFDVKQLALAPEYDGHQPSDIGRLMSIIKKEEDE